MRSAAIAVAVFFSGCSGEDIAPVGPPGPRAVDFGASAYDSERGRLVIYGGVARTSGEMLPISTTWEWDGASWEQNEQSGGPGPLAEHAMAYNPITKRVLLYGGLGGARSCQRTWEYDGESWVELDIEDAGCRWRHTMTWDPQRGAVIMFGGVTDVGCTDGQCQETWSFDGLSWALIVLPRP